MIYNSAFYDKALYEIAYINFFNDNVICLGRWYYDSTDVESYYLDLEKEEELRKEKEF